MPYIAETDEIIFDEEERDWVMNNPKSFSHMLELNKVCDKVSYNRVAYQIQEILRGLRRRHLIPVSLNGGISVAPINKTNYADLQIEFEWNKDTLTYTPVKFLVRKKGGREYNKIVIENFIWEGMNCITDRISIQGKLWKYK